MRGPACVGALGLAVLFGFAVRGAAGQSSALKGGSGRAAVQAEPGVMLPGVAGMVKDPSGAVVRGAEVELIGLDAGKDSRPESSGMSGPTGDFRLYGRPGTYVVVVEAKGFARFESGALVLGRQAGQRMQELPVQLKIETHLERMDISDENQPDDETAAGANHNGSAIVLSGRDIRNMPLDPTALLDELQALAGSPNAELYVDGFSGAKLPSRESISEIRINQNPYSAENDTNPVNGVIEVSTKPGTGEMHGQAYMYGDDSGLNAANPFIPNQPGYYAFGAGGFLSGPLNRVSSYFASLDEMTQRTNSAVDAQTLDANLNRVQLSNAVASPLTTLNFAPKLDLRAGANSTMIFRYIYDLSRQTNGGVGQLALASQGFDNQTVAQTLQLSNIQTIGRKMVNETRFEYVRTRSTQTPVSTAPALSVEGAFLGGGNDEGRFSDSQDRFELQNYVSYATEGHYLNFGGRLRVGREANDSLANYNGEFIFASLGAYQTTLEGIAAGESMAQIIAAGGGASQFNLNAGTPNVAIAVADGSLFAQDDWKVRQNLTLSYGLRFETQSYIADHADWAPRAGFTWGLGGGGGHSKYVLRGGAGIFYRRFTTESAMQVERQDGVRQQEYVVESPSFYPAVPPVSSLGAQAAPTVYRVSPHFHAPYFIGTTLGLDRQLGRHGTLSVTYLYNRGVHTQLTENVNAPLPGTYDPSNPMSGVRPYGGNQNIYEFVSEGVYRSRRLSFNATLRPSPWFTAFGYYTLRYDKSDAEPGGGFPSDQYDLGADYGRSLDDVRNTLTLGATTNLPFGFHSWGYLHALSGAPFNIVVGQDLNGDTQFNSRPAFATDLSRPSVVETKWGTFDTDPIPGQTIIPRDYGTGPSYFLVNLAVGRSFYLGRAPGAAALSSTGAGGAQKAAAQGSGAPKYLVEFWLESQNLLNHPNPATPIGTLNSPLFGRSIALAGSSALSPDRIVDMQLSLQF